MCWSVAIVDRWSARLVAAEEAAQGHEAPVQRVRSTVHRLVWFRARFCDEFWSDLAADHPEVWERFVELFDQVQARTAEWMSRSVRPGVDPELARALLRVGVEMAVRRDTTEVLGQDTDRTIDAVIDLWAFGALTPRAAPSAAGHSKSSS